MMRIGITEARPPCRQADFRFDESHGIYLHGGARPEGCGGYVYDTLKSARDLSAYSGELHRRIRDWPSRYHFSPMRSNLLEGVAELFGRDSRVLEVGSGCGALTRWLGERFREVDAFEEDLCGAAATRARTSGLENVKVYAGNVMGVSLDGKYDIITLIGGLAYAPLHDTGGAGPGWPCIRMLGKLYDSLSSRGILALAIGNRLGAKYLSGCSEDHVGKPFIGVEGYPGRSPVTFARNELEAILRRSGFENVQFYHLFPDHKLTSTIIVENDEVLPLRPYNWIKTPFEDNAGKRLNLLVEPLFLKTITDAGLLWQHSNAFLVLAGRSEETSLRAEWLIRKFNNESHSDRFKHQVTLKKEGGSGYKVSRVPVVGNKPRLDVRGVEYRLDDDEYFPGELLILDVYKALREGDPGPSIGRMLRMLHDSLVLSYSTGTADADGYPLVSGRAVDYTFWNIVSSEGGALRFIDRKWRMAGEIPADYVLFRNLLYFYNGWRHFLKGRSRRNFITGQIRAIYPRYSRGRLERNAALEEEFQSAVSDKKVKVYIDDPLGIRLVRVRDVVLGLVGVSTRKRDGDGIVVPPVKIK